MVKFELTPAAHVAKVLNTNVNVIAQLMFKVSKNPQHLRSLWTEHQQKQTAKDEVIEAVEEILDDGGAVETVSFVKD
jgi:transposase